MVNEEKKIYTPRMITENNSEIYFQPCKIAKSANIKQTF